MRFLMSRHCLLLLFCCAGVSRLWGAAEPATPPDAKLTPAMPAELAGAQSGSASPGVQAVSATSTPAIQVRHLESIRVRPSGDTLRVILALDAPAPYTVRAEPSQAVAYVDLINVQVDYLAAELAQLNDPRLRGIWLQTRQAGLSTLEFRFPARAVKIDHFALSNPPAIILDLSRADQPVATLGSAPKDFAASAGASSVAVAEPAATQTPVPAPALAPMPIALQKGGSALPEDWLQSHPALPGLIADARTSQTTHAEAPVSSVGLGVTVVNHELSPQPAGAHAVSTALASAPGEDEIRLINRDFDDFPVDRLDVSSPIPKSIRQSFLNRHWAEVINEGVAYLKEKRINQDSVYVLYMVAEARYQLGNAQMAPPYGDMINFYQQAVRMDESTELGSFAAFRLAQMFLARQDFGSALAVAGQATRSQDPSVRRRALMLLARAQGNSGNEASAFQTLATLRGDPHLTKDQLLETLTYEAGMRADMKDPAGACSFYQTAAKLDPGWVSLDPAGGEKWARAALEAGHPDDARRQLEFLNRSFSFRDDGQKVSLALLYAKALEQLGDLKTAEETYALLLGELGASAKGREVQKLLGGRYQQDLISSEGSYANLLMRKGDPRAAMEELHKAYQQGLRGGADVGPLDSLIEMATPAFMQEAVKQNRPFDAVQAWRIYGGQVRDPVQRWNCQRPLAFALAALGLPGESRQIVDRLLQGGQSDPELKRLSVKLDDELGAQDSALKTLKELTSLPVDDNRPATLRMLAKTAQSARQPLLAAQAWQALARQPGLEAQERGDALLSAGNLFLQQGMPLQTIELGLKGLILEKEQLQQRPLVTWSAQTGNSLAMMLARAYMAKGDWTRATLVLKSLLGKPWQDSAQVAEARWLLAKAQRLTGQPDKAEDALDALDKDSATPQLWRQAAQDVQSVSKWNLQHPEWAIDQRLTGQD